MPASKANAQPSAAGGDTDSEHIAADICVIGAGPGGLAVATGAAAFGRSVVLIERNNFGGDVLHSGCIPSRALAAVANRAHAMRSAGALGLPGFGKLLQREHTHRLEQPIATGTRVTVELDE